MRSSAQVGFRRKLIPLVAAVMIAALIGGVARLFEFSAPVTYALGGVLLAFVVIFGTPYAFGAPAPWQLLDHGRQVLTDEATLRADQDQGDESATNGHATVIAADLNEPVLIPSSPVVGPAEGTGSTGTRRIELRNEFFRIGHVEIELSGLRVEPNGEEREPVVSSDSST
jgi:hypothetical protein